jgi:hypothetical protein
LYLMLSATIYVIAAIVGEVSPTTFRDIYAWVWLLFGHTEPIANPRMPVEFASFAVSLQLIVAALWSCLVTAAAQLVFNRSHRPR